MNGKGIFAPKPRNAILTIPNVITIFGFIFTGLYVWSFLSALAMWKIFLFLFLAGMTDALDGISARFLKQETSLGEILDPIRDRVLMLAILWNFWMMSNGNTRFLICVILSILSLETAVSILNAIIKKDGRKIYHIYGKARQAGHLFAASLGVTGILDAEIVMFIMYVFSIVALYGAAVGYFLLKERGRMAWKDSD